MPTNEPKPEKALRAPNVPGWLPENARTVWKQHARALWDLGLLTLVDVDALAALCEATALYRTALEMIENEGAVWVNKGTGYSQQTAWVSVRNTALAQMQKLWAEFGMTPSARTRIEVAPEAVENPLEALMGRARANAGGG